MRRLWFYKLFDAVLFSRLMSVGEITTWVFLDWKGRALSKRGVVCGTSVYRISWWQTTKKLLCCKLQWWTLPRDGHNLQCWSENFLVGEGGGVEIRTCNTCCLRDIKAMETVITVFYNQNSCKCLQEGLTLYNDKKGNIWKGAWSWSWGDLTYQPIFRQTYWGLLGCGNGVINNEYFIIYTACSP